MDELRHLHKHLVSLLLAVVLAVLPAVAWQWPHRLPWGVAAILGLVLLATLVAHQRDRMSTPRAAQTLIFSLALVVVGGSLWLTGRAGSPAQVLDTERHNLARALILAVGGAYVTLGRRRGRRIAAVALTTWAAITLVVISQTTPHGVTLDVLASVHDVALTTVLAATLFDVAARNTRVLEEDRRIAQRTAGLDELTKLHNRHGVIPAMQAALARPTDAALIVLDLDHFKRINDTHGHPAGDKILREVARALTAASRPDDVVGRWGGEEFVLVLHAGGRDAAERVAIKIRQAMRDISSDIPVTASFGLAVVEHDDTVETLFQRADSTLFEAKGLGRDRIMMSWPPTPGETRAVARHNLPEGERASEKRRQGARRN